MTEEPNVFLRHGSETGWRIMVEVMRERGPRGDDEQKAAFCLKTAQERQVITGSAEFAKKR